MGASRQTYTQQRALGIGRAMMGYPRVTMQKEGEDGKFNRFSNFNRRFLFNIDLIKNPFEL